MTKQIVDGNNTVFAVAAATNDVVAIDGLTGQELWRSHFTGPITSLLLGPDQRLYLTAVVGGRATLHVGTVGPPVSVTAVSPIQPTVSATSQPLTIFGSNFQAGASVLLTPPNGQSTLISSPQVNNVRSGSLVANVNFAGVPGLYSIQVTNPNGVVSNSVSFNVGCDLALTATPPASVTRNVAATFSSTVSGCTGSITYDWDFGDGTPHAATASPTHTYSAEGTFTWRLRVSPQNGVAKTRQGTLLVHPVPSGSLRGFVLLGDGITAADPGSGRFVLDGPGVTVNVQATRVGTGATTTVAAINGYYVFPSLQNGDYTLSANVTYAYAPSAGLVTTRIARPGQINLPNGVMAHNIVAPAPIVMLHGWLSSQSKWNGEGNWAQAARDGGHLVFTPTYGGCRASGNVCGVLSAIQDRWEITAFEVYNEIAADFIALSSGITNTKFPGWRAIGHSQGGLIVRALVAGANRSRPLVGSLRKVYLLGTPNSGGEFFGLNVGYYLLENSIRREFNSEYRSFGGKDVVAFGGTGLGGYSDGLVSLTSLRYIILRTTVGLIFVREDILQGFPNGCNRPVLHTTLGDPGTLTLLTQHILPDAQCLTNAPSLGGNGGEQAVMESKRISDVKRFALASGSTDNQQIVVGPTDALQLDAFVETGQPLIELLDPNGQVLDFASLPAGAGSRSTDELGQHFVLANPAAGTWMVRVTAQDEPCQVACSISETSPISFAGYVASDEVLTGGQATILGQFNGIVGSASVTADVVDQAGVVIGSLTLLDDGMHGDGAASDGLFGAQSPTLTQPGRYVAVIRGEATTQSLQIRRYAETSFDVTPGTQAFTGTFSDLSLDTDDDAIVDTLRFTAEATAATAGTYSVQAELVDSTGYHIGQAVGSVTATGPGTVSVDLDFSLRDARCVQFGGPFKVRNLQISDATGPSLLSTWPGDIPTTQLDGNAFNCVSDIPSPTVVAVQPSTIRRGLTTEITISGTSFLAGAIASCGPGVSLSGMTLDGPGRIRAMATVDVGAQLGAHDVSVTNVDLNVGVGAGLLTISDDNPPAVSIPYPLADGVIEGTITTSASVSDDVGIDRVEFRIDNVLVGTDSSFPYQYVWNTTAVAEGPHTLTATAFDSIGQSTAVSVSVTADNCRIDQPSNLTVEASPQAGSCGAVVSYEAPGATSPCGGVTCSPAPGSFFAVGRRR